MIREKKTIYYKDFYLIACYTEKDSPVYIGTVYSKKFDKYRWKTSDWAYNKIVYGYGLDSTINRMKQEVDKFYEIHKKYLKKEIEATTLYLKKLKFDLNSLP